MGHIKKWRPELVKKLKIRENTTKNSVRKRVLKDEKSSKVRPRGHLGQKRSADDDFLVTWPKNRALTRKNIEDKWYLKHRSVMWSHSDSENPPNHLLPKIYKNFGIFLKIENGTKISQKYKNKFLIENRMKKEEWILLLISR